MTDNVKKIVEEFCSLLRSYSWNKKWCINLKEDGYIELVAYTGGISCSVLIYSEKDFRECLKGISNEFHYVKMKKVKPFKNKQSYEFTI